MLFRRFQNQFAHRNDVRIRCNDQTTPVASYLGDSLLDFSFTPHGRCVYRDSRLLRQCFE